LPSNETAPFEYIASICNLWREYDDIRANWDEIMKILNYQESAKLAQFAGTICYIDIYEFIINICTLV